VEVISSLNENLINMVLNDLMSKMEFIKSSEERPPRGLAKKTFIENIHEARATLDARPPELRQERANVMAKRPLYQVKFRLMVASNWNAFMAFKVLAAASLHFRQG